MLYGNCHIFFVCKCMWTKQISFMDNKYMNMKYERQIVRKIYGYDYNYTNNALNFRSGAYNFHKLPKNPFRSITILNFLADFAVPETIIFKISLISTRSSPPTAGSARTRGPGSSGDSHFHASKRIKLVPEPRIFTLKTAQARSGTPHFQAQARHGSGAPHFHARPGARSGALAHFSLYCGTYLPKFGVSTPPPPPPGWRQSEWWHLPETDLIIQHGYNKRKINLSVTVSSSPSPITTGVLVGAWGGGGGACPPPPNKIQPWLIFNVPTKYWKK